MFQKKKVGASKECHGASNEHQESLSTLRSCLYTTITGREAEQLLMDKGQDGSFLLRRSTSTRGQFSVSVRTDKNVEHTPICYEDDLYDVDGKEMFPTLTGVIQHMMSIKGLVKKDGSWLRFLHPLYADEIPDHSWFHGDIIAATAQRLLKENGKPGAFLVRISQSKTGQFVLSVLLEDGRVEHVKIQRDGNNQYGGIDDGMYYESLEKLIRYHKKNPICKTDGTTIAIKTPCDATKFPAYTIGERLINMQIENSITAEFDKLLSFDPPGAMSHGKKPCNKTKNRYKNILPFDHTRVELKLANHKEDGADYINASHVDNTYDHRDRKLFSQRKYIAAQGCLPKTVAQFWEMIWQEKVTVVVMTTRETEEGKFKCAKYWPDDEGGEESHECFGDTITVKMISENNFTHHVERELNVSKGKKTRKLTHFHFVAWPDHGVPTDPGILVWFLDSVKAKYKAYGRKNSPLFVHCSAGIGRTGTVIVLDIILSQLIENGLGCAIDVMETCKLARRQRPGLIQTPAQYEFVYSCIARYVEVQQKLLQDQEGNKSTETYCNVESLRHKPEDKEGTEPIYEETTSLQEAWSQKL